MSTKCRIGILNEDKSITSVLCHWDGSPETVGETLYESWDDAGKVESLLEGGDINELGNDLDETSYQLSEGEESYPSVTHSSNQWPESGQEYEYLFNPKSESWSVRSEDSGWESLGTVLTEEDEDEDEDWDDDDFDDDDDGWDDED